MSSSDRSRLYAGALDYPAFPVVSCPIFQYGRIIFSKTSYFLFLYFLFYLPHITRPDRLRRSGLLNRPSDLKSYAEYRKCVLLFLSPLVLPPSLPYLCPQYLNIPCLCAVAIYYFYCPGKLPAVLLGTKPPTPSIAS